MTVMQEPTSNPTLPAVHRVRASNAAVEYLDRARRRLPPEGGAMLSQAVVAAAGIFYGAAADPIGEHEMRSLVIALYGRPFAWRVGSIEEAGDGG